MNVAVELLTLVLSNYDKSSSWSRAVYTNLAQANFQLIIKLLTKKRRKRSNPCNHSLKPAPAICYRGPFENLLKSSTLVFIFFLLARCSCCMCYQRKIGILGDSPEY